MTTLRIISSMLLLVLISTAVTAQTHFNNDPGVSVHNYKHPHKARQAARLSTDNPNTLPATGQTTDQADIRQTARNYKAGNQPNRVSDTLLVLPGREVEYTNNPLMTKDNYKRQFNLPVPSKQPAERQQENLAQAGQLSANLPK